MLRRGRESVLSERSRIKRRIMSVISEECDIILTIIRKKEDEDMANKYSKSNNSKKAAENKTMQDYEARRKKLNRGAKIMALILVAAMVVFYVISAGLFLWN